MRILVPSKEVTSQSLDTPATGVASTWVGALRRQPAAEVAVAVEADGAAVEAAADPVVQAANTRDRRATATAEVGRAPVTLSRSPLCSTSGVSHPPCRRSTRDRGIGGDHHRDAGRITGGGEDRDALREVEIQNASEPMAT
jgi:hypothetical protein